MPHLNVRPEAEPSLIVYVRHGMSLYNAVCGDRRWLPNREAYERIAHLSENETPLVSPDGFKQAERTGHAIRTLFPEGFDMAFHSDAIRTKSTLMTILDAAGYVNPPCVRSTYLLNERHSGALWRMTEEDMETHCPWYPEYREREGWFRSEPPGGESVERVMLRIQELRRKLRKEAAGQRVLLSGHGTFGLGWRVDLEGFPTDTPNVPFRYIANCEWLTYVRNDNTGQLVLDADRSPGAQ